MNSKKVNQRMTVHVLWFALALSVILTTFAYPLRAEAAVRDVAAGGSIAAAIAAANKGDTISIAPGVYRETIRVSKPGLTITSATRPGGEPDVVIESPGGTALTDSHDTSGGAYFFGPKTAVRPWQT